MHRSIDAYSIKARHVITLTRIHTSVDSPAGIIGIGIGLCAASLAVLAAGALFGLALTMGLLSIPRSVDHAQGAVEGVLL